MRKLDADRDVPPPPPRWREQLKDLDNPHRPPATNDARSRHARIRASRVYANRVNATCVNANSDRTNPACPLKATIDDKYIIIEVPSNGEENGDPTLAGARLASKQLKKGPTIDSPKPEPPIVNDPLVNLPPLTPDEEDQLWIEGLDLSKCHLKGTERRRLVRLLNKYREVFSRNKTPGLMTDVEFQIDTGDNTPFK